MRVPDYLTGEAKKYWQKHAKRLADAGILTAYDLETFGLLCQVYALVRSCNTDDVKAYATLLTKYQQLARQFHLMPRDRAQAGKDTSQNEVDDYGL